MALFLLFLAVVIPFWTGLHLYVLQRAASIPAIAKRVPRKLLFAIFGFLWLCFPLGMLLGHLGLEFPVWLLELIGANWLGVLFLLFISLLAVDLVTLFGLILKSWKTRLRGAALLIAAVLAVIALVQGYRAPVVREYEVRLDDLPVEADGTKLAALADLHLDGQLAQRWLAARIAQVQALRPDLIVVLGDVVEDHGGAGRSNAYRPLLRGLQAPLGVWAVTGNHEFYGGLDDSARQLEQAGMHVLRNRWSEVRPGLIIAGVDDSGSNFPNDLDARNVVQTLAGRPASTATIFLSHRPIEAETAAEQGAGLMLSGHTHGGQIWPFNYVVKLTTPFVGGRYSVNDMTMIVSRGTGLWGPRMRLWSRGEILLITLHSKD